MQILFRSTRSKNIIKKASSPKSPYSHLTHCSWVREPGHYPDDHVELLMVGSHAVQLRVLVSGGVPGSHHTDLIFCNDENCSAFRFSISLLIIT